MIDRSCVFGAKKEKTHIRSLCIRLPIPERGGAIKGRASECGIFIKEEEVPKRSFAAKSFIATDGRPTDQLHFVRVCVHSIPVRSELSSHFGKVPQSSPGPRGALLKSETSLSSSSSSSSSSSFSSHIATTTAAEDLATLGNNIGLCSCSCSASASSAPFACLPGPLRRKRGKVVEERGRGGKGAFAKRSSFPLFGKGRGGEEGGGGRKLIPK